MQQSERRRLCIHFAFRCCFHFSLLFFPRLSNSSFDAVAWWLILDSLAVFTSSFATTRALAAEHKLLKYYSRAVFRSRYFSSFSLFYYGLKWYERNTTWERRKSEREMLIGRFEKDYMKKFSIFYRLPQEPTRKRKAANGEKEKAHIMKKESTNVKNFKKM